MPKFLIGERIYLRALEREDLGKCLEWHNDPEIRKFAGEIIPINKEKLEEFFDLEIKDRDKIWFSIMNKADDELIGDLRLYLKFRTGDIGIVIEKAYWSKGYGTEVMKLALDYCFNTLDLHRVELWVFEFNTRAIRCYEKVGFKREGVKREDSYKNGKYCNSLVMGILRDEWMKDA